jgi:ribosome-associated toxin RatA of RatAB toxin-antitoxin module
MIHHFRHWNKLSTLVLTPLLLGVPIWLHNSPASSSPPYSPIHSLAQPFQIALTSQEQSTLQQGRVLFAGQEGNYTARVMANGSVDTAWAVLTDYNHFSNFLPSVESSKLIESNGSQKKFEQVNAVRVFLFTRRERVVIATSEDYPAKISFGLAEGNLKSLQGAWLITKAGNQVMITHQVSVNPGRSGRGLFFSIYEDNLRKTMAAVKQEIERRSGRSA